MGRKKQLISSLPEDNIYQILLFLPVKSVVRFSLVCKSWRTLTTSNEEFIRSHLIQATSNNDNHVELLMFNDYKNKAKNCDLLVDGKAKKFRDQLSLVLTNNPVLGLGRDLAVAGCYAGVICLYNHTSCTIYLWNPALHQCKIIRYQGEYRGWADFDFIGFGCDPQNHDPKVVTVSCLKETAEIKMYSLKNHSWKSFDCSLPHVDYTDRLYVEAQLDFNGYLHWITEVTFHNGEVEKSVLAFDFAHKKLSLLPLPSSVSNTKTFFKSLGVLDGCVSFITFDDYYTNWDVWSMKTHGVPESWVKIAVIPCIVQNLGYINLLGINTKGVILIMKSGSVFAYDHFAGKPHHKETAYSKSRAAKTSLIGYQRYFFVDSVESMVSVMPPTSPSPLPFPTIAE